MSERTVVVGAGVIGLLTAWELRRNGHDVTVISPDVGEDASYAAAGMLAPISEVQYGQQELWPIMTAARDLYPQVLKSLAEATAEPTGYRDTGTVLIAYDRSDRDAVAELVSVLVEQGMDAEPMTSTQLQRYEPALAPGTSKGWNVPSDHQVDPRQLVRCLTAALNVELAEDGVFSGAGEPAQWVSERVVSVRSSAGADESAPAGAASPDGVPAETALTETAPTGAVAVTTQSGVEHRFDRAVLTPGLGYADIEGLPQEAPVSLRPIHGDVLRLRVRPEQLLPGERQLINSTLRARVGGRQVYLVPRADGGLVLGASSREDSLAGTHTGSVQELLDDAAAVVPGIKETELVEITTRARPGTPDERPYLGTIVPGVVVSTGYSRHGILLAPLAARLATALLAGDDGDVLRRGGRDDVDVPAAARLTEQDRRLLRSMDPARHAAGHAPRGALASRGTASGSSRPAVEAAVRRTSPESPRSSTGPRTTPLTPDRTTSHREERKMPTLTINEESATLPAGSSLVDAVAHTTGRQLSADGSPLDGKRLGVAVALGADVVPRSAWSSTTLDDGDEIEIVTAVQGG